MEHVVKNFTIIDFLGIFTPGAIAVLALQYYIGGLTRPFECFFGENAGMLAVYFIALSYLCGSFLHQLGGILEELVTLVSRCCNQNGRENFHIDYWENPKVVSAYQEKINPELPKTAQEKLKAGRQVYHYIQRNHRPQRILLFNAFYTMSRTMVITLLLIMLLIVNYQENSMKCIMLVACLSLCGLSVYRWFRFERKSVDEAYLLLVSEESVARKG